MSEEQSKAVIIFVEDEEMDVRHFKRMMKKHAFEAPIETFRDADSAWNYIASRSGARDGARIGVPNGEGVVLVTDINMPGTTGHELIEMLRDDPYTAGMVIFVYSTSDLPGDIQRAYKNGVAGYIVKDSTGRALSEGVQMLRHYCNAVTLPS